jgi:hypothetical protein
MSITIYLYNILLKCLLEQTEEQQTMASKQTLPPVPSDNQCTPSAAGGVGMLYANVRGTILYLPKATLLTIPWFETLLSGRWDKGESVPRDQAGRLFIDEDPELFQALLDYVRYVRRSTPLTANYPPPSFEGNKESFSSHD